MGYHEIYCSYPRSRVNKYKDITKKTFVCSIKSGLYEGYYSDDFISTDIRTGDEKHVILFHDKK